MPFATAVKNPIVASPAGLRDTQLADLGNYFNAYTPTLGTGIVTATSVNTFDETKPTFLLYNAGPLNIYPMMLQTHITVVGADATPSVVNATVTMDIGNRYTSGGTVLKAFSDTLNPNVNTGAFLVVGAITATAKTPVRRLMGNLSLKTVVLEVVHDTAIIHWADPFTGSSNSIVDNSTTPTYNNYTFPPFVVAPNTSMLVTVWSATQTTGSTREYSFSWVEK